MHTRPATTKQQQRQGGALLTEILDYFDPAKPEADAAPAEVQERFGQTVPTVTAEGLTIGDIEVVGLFSKWIKYEQKNGNQVPLTQVQQGGKIKVPVGAKRIGTVTLGLNIDDTIYDVQNCTIRSDFVKTEGDTNHPDKFKLLYYFDVPATIAPGPHTFSIVEGYKTNTMSYDEVCWYEESARVQVEVTKKPVPPTFVIQK